MITHTVPRHHERSCSPIITDTPSCGAGSGGRLTCRRCNPIPLHKGDHASVQCALHFGESLVQNIVFVTQLAGPPTIWLLSSHMLNVAGLCIDGDFLDPHFQIPIWAWLVAESTEGILK